MAGHRPVRDLVPGQPRRGEQPRRRPRSARPRRRRRGRGTSPRATRRASAVPDSTFSAYADTCVHPGVHGGAHECRATTPRVSPVSRRSGPGSPGRSRQPAPCVAAGHRAHRALVPAVQHGEHAGSALCIPIDSRFTPAASRSSSSPGSMFSGLASTVTSASGVSPNSAAIGRSRRPGPPPADRRRGAAADEHDCHRRRRRPAARRARRTSASAASRHCAGRPPARLRRHVRVEVAVPAAAGAVRHVDVEARTASRTDSALSAAVDPRRRHRDGRSNCPRCRRPAARNSCSTTLRFTFRLGREVAGRRPSVPPG